MKRLGILLLVIYVLLVSCEVLDGQVAITHTETTIVTGLENPEIVEDVILASGTPKVEKAWLVNIDTEASIVRVNAETRNRDRVDIKKISPTRIIVPRGERIWLRVVVVDFEKNIFDEQIVTFGQTNDPDDEPDDDGSDVEDEEPDDAIPSSVPNDLGIGHSVYKLSPGTELDEAADIYRRAANFLYGIPSLKSITTPNPNNTRTNVLAWMRAEFNQLSIEWHGYPDLINDTFREAQTKSDGFTRKEWHQAFLEAAVALEIKNDS
jgi:hypothetical protein